MSVTCCIGTRLLHSRKAFIELVVERDLADHVRDVMGFELKDTDVFLTAFPKSGMTLKH